ncbi:MAG: glycosyltransferase family 4 protein [Armatimonadota bacterium]
MRIGIDARCLTGAYTGDRTYWEGLIGGLASLSVGLELVLFSDRDIPAGVVAADANIKQVVIPSRWGRYFSFVQLPEAAHQYQCDVMHVQYSVSPLFRMPVVTTIHDVSFKLYPECFRAKDRWLLSRSVPAAIRRAAQVITVSESSRNDIIRAMHVDPAKIHATPLAVPARLQSDSTCSEEVLSPEELADGYFMLLGVLQPRKNLPLAVRAYACYREKGGMAQLLIVGKAGWGEDTLNNTVNQCGVSEYVRFTGYVQDNQLHTLYTRAKALLYPSLYEGFGLPPLEAMSLGCPVIASDIPVMHEVCGDAAILLPPTEADLWADAMLSLTPEYRKQRSVLGQNRSSRFSWTDTAQQTYNVYKLAHQAANNP